MALSVIIDKSFNFFQHFNYNEVSKRALLSFVILPKSSKIYFINQKSYLTLTNLFIINSRGPIDSWP